MKMKAKLRESEMEGSQIASVSETRAIATAYSTAQPTTMATPTAAKHTARATQPTQPNDSTSILVAAPAA